jgi:predicted HAD superfamily Cof-like phosphohydrolase
MTNPFAEGRTVFDFTPLEDIAEFHEKFGLQHPHGKQSLHPEEWTLRHRRLRDELLEYEKAVEDGDDEEVLDGLVDLIYIALGTAYRRGWDIAEAWRRVHSANMAKERGKANNSKYGSGFDIVKPDGWTGPDHSDLV